MRTQYQAIYDMILEIKDLGANEELINKFFITVATLQSHNERMERELEIRR